MDDYGADLTPDQAAWLDERAPLEGLDRSGLVSLVIEYAMTTMPPGWRPHNDVTLRMRRAGIEARVVAKRPAQVERDQPGYLERLAALPREEQTEQIRRDVFPEATGAHLPFWSEGLDYVAVPWSDDGSMSTAKIE